MALPSNYPAQQGLYDPANEHDACGVAMVATLNKVATHEIVDKALTALRNLEHRGASGAEPDSGDGAGILIRVPDAFYRAVVDFNLPAEGSYATGIAFVAQGAEVRDEIAKIAAEEGITILGCFLSTLHLLERPQFQLCQSLNRYLFLEIKMNLELL